MQIRTAAFIAVMTLGLSCARYCGDQAYARVVNEQTEAYAYSASPDVVWREASAILEERGAEFGTDAAPVDAPVISQWQGKPGNRRRYSVRIIAGEDTRLEVHKLTELEVKTYGDMDVPDLSGPRKPTGTKLEKERRRDFSVEWEVLRRLDPTRATEIEQMAAERREEVVDVVSEGCT